MNLSISVAIREVAAWAYYDPNTQMADLPPRPGREVFEDFFTRYDLDESGTMNAQNELKPTVRALS